MIWSIALTALGVCVLALALIEVLGSVFESVHAVRSVVKRAFGQPAGNLSDMEQAMQWLQVMGLFLIGGSLFAAGLAVGSN